MVRELSEFETLFEMRTVGLRLYNKMYVFSFSWSFCFSFLLLIIEAEELV